MSINELKTGDIILVRKPFLWWYINHCAIIVERSTLTDKIIYVYEIKGKGFIKTKYHKWKKKYQFENCLYRRPNFKFIPETIEHTSYRIEGTREELTDMVIAQVIRQITLAATWIQRIKKRLFRTLFSSETVMFLFYVACNGSYFMHWYKIEPNDLRKSELFDDIIVK